MNQFRRAIRLLLFIVGGVAGILSAIALFITRFVIRPPRQQIWATPQHFGMAYEDVQFPARDGVRIAGWFIPAPKQHNAPTLIILHGWPWCRAGTVPTKLLNHFPRQCPARIFAIG